MTAIVLFIIIIITVVVVIIIKIIKAAHDWLRPLSHMFLFGLMNYRAEAVLVQPEAVLAQSVAVLAQARVGRARGGLSFLLP